MKTVKIIKNSNGDTRTADHIPTMEEFNIANESHISDVHNLLRAYGEEIANSKHRTFMDESECHDFTKIIEPYKSMFYRDLCNCLEGNMKFDEGNWIKEHYNLERHHLNDRCPDDVTLIDVIEMICDIVAAGMARSCKVYPLKIKPEVLEKAVSNTVEFLKDNIELVDETEEYTESIDNADVW